MTKSTLWPLLATLLPALAACESKKDAPPPGPPPPVPVLVTTVAQREVPLYLESVGTIDGYINADIRARVRGFLKSQDFKDGAEVKQGELLFTIDPSEYSAAVESAKGQVAQANAVRTRALLDRARDQTLNNAGAIAPAQLDVAVTTAAQSEGQTAVAQAQLRQSQINLGYTRITSPVTGIAGLALVRVGNLVGQDGPTLLTTVSQIDPMRVTFPISEADFIAFGPRFRNLDARDLDWAHRQFKSMATGGEPEGQSAIEVILADGKPYPLRGVIVTTNRQVDANTGTLMVQALFPNPDKLLRPGQYGRVRIRRDDHTPSLVVPARALIQVQGTTSLAVVGPDNKVQVRRVEAGPTVGPLQVIRSGVSVGDRVVVEGTQKANDGATVDPKPAPDNIAAMAASAAASASAGASTAGPSSSSR